MPPLTNRSILPILYLRHTKWKNTEFGHELIKSYTKLIAEKKKEIEYKNLPMIQ